VYDVEVFVVLRKVQFVWNDGALKTLMAQSDRWMDVIDEVDEHALVRY
jgi:hypothetical protein